MAFIGRGHDKKIPTPLESTRRWGKDVTTAGMPIDSPEDRAATHAKSPLVKPHDTSSGLDKSVRALSQAPNSGKTAISETQRTLTQSPTTNGSGDLPSPVK